MTNLKTVSIKGKDYVQVNERLRYFRQNYSGYALETQIVSVTDETALMRAIIRDPFGAIIATGTAYERANAPGSMVNKTSHVENCETSAWGRALGNFGIGIDDSVASAEEVQSAVLNQGMATPEQMSLIDQLVTQLGRDKAKMWKHYGVPTGSPTGLLAAKIITQLSEFKRKLSADLDATATRDAA